MEADIENVLLAVCAAVGQAAVLLATDDEPATKKGPKQVLTVSSLKFEPMLQSAAHSSWFEDNLRCTQTTFLRIASFLAQHGVLFASAKVKQHSYNKKVAASLYFLGSSGGYRETSHMVSAPDWFKVHLEKDT
ncbi:hypothetical protein GN958_ATG22526 [Phytophthora infestans]|uniref:Uncharacterized protein n=1 Tax=Phytophthora infestans TaxID=4787 RepID=A0A8S9TNY9_PHYIN|nr:hypothetical protein GN958_ATG22526 [Phytophthora infestans]